MLEHTGSREIREALVENERHAAHCSYLSPRPIFFPYIFAMAFSVRI